MDKPLYDKTGGLRFFKFLIDDKQTEYKLTYYQMKWIEKRIHIDIEEYLNTIKLFKTMINKKLYKGLFINGNNGFI